jgi:Kelch motif protein/galactose oxidase-like protein
MKVILNISRLAAVAIVLAAAPANAGSDAGNYNHYILECGGQCQPALVPATIGPRHTGAWFDPAQSGHGLFVEVLPDNKIQVAWFTFNPEGTEQAWFLGVGTYLGNTATIKVVQPTGGRWIPNFDSSRVVANSWGTLTLTFTDADHGTAKFASKLGYGTGSMRLFRLTSPATAKDPRWTRTGEMNFSRVGHKALLLSDGKVLVVGGFEAYGLPPGGAVYVDPNDEAPELFDPASGTWRLTGKLNFVRGSGFTATIMQDGNVLVTGGVPPCCGGLVTKTAELYDVKTGTWRVTGPMNSVRSGHTASLLADGRVLVVAGGGTNFPDVLDTAEVYDPATGKWTYTGKLFSGRTGHSATVLQDGKVLVFGGHIYDDWGDWIGVPGAELYDPAAGVWIPYDGPADGASFVSHGETVRLADGRVMSAGGEEIAYGASTKSFIFDPVTRNWANADRLIMARFGHSTTVLSNGDVLVTGGRSSPVLVGAERYQLLTRKWVPSGALNTPRIGHSATLLADGSVLFAGGYVPGSDDPWAEVVSSGAELFLDGQLSPSAILPAFTGSWYDPAQSGHGLMVEVLPDGHFLAAWFTFNPAGNQQSWFLGVGTYGGDTATITSVLQPTGGRWIPNFDASKVANNPWGTLKFTFTDCNHGKVDFASSSGYGTGSMSLTRLTQPAGFACPPGT